MKKRRGVPRALLELVLISLVIVLTVERRSANTEWRETVVHRVPTTEKVVALTFDDGPHPVFTPELLKVLDKYPYKKQ